jgi:FixJ family two-component response regulator
MTPTERQPTVFIVDDDPSVRDSLQFLLESVALEVRTFASAQDFLDGADPEAPGCVLLDVRMPGMSGLDLQNELVNADISLPIIFITGHGTVPMSVRAMKAGAVDFLQKPFDQQDLLNAVYQAIEQDRQARLKTDELTRIQKRINSLTPREYEVFTLLASGMLNKQVAYRLGTTERTIKAHRSRIMAKMQAESLADLVRHAAKLGVDKPRE